MDATLSSLPDFMRLKPLKSWIKPHVIEIMLGLGLEVSLKTLDRKILEQLIFPYFAAKKPQRVLFVGCQWYTKHYPKYFRDSEFWTIEIDPDAQKYGSVHHVIDGVQNVAAHFEPGFFDLIVYNGVFGWGVNTMADAENAFAGCYRCLSDRGILVFGWNNVPDRTPFLPESCPSWQQFKPYYFAPLDSWHYFVPFTIAHTYRFLSKS